MSLNRIEKGENSLNEKEGEKKKRRYEKRYEKIANN